MSLPQVVPYTSRVQRAPPTNAGFVPSVQPGGGSLGSLPSSGGFSGGFGLSPALAALLYGGGGGGGACSCNTPFYGVQPSPIPVAPSVLAPYLQPLSQLFQQSPAQFAVNQYGDVRVVASGPSYTGGFGALAGFYAPASNRFGVPFNIVDALGGPRVVQAAYAQAGFNEPHPSATLVQPPTQTTAQFLAAQTPKPRAGSQIGSLVGTALGGVVGSLISPGGGTLVGAGLGGALGSYLGGL